MSVDLMRLCWRVEFPSSAMSAVAVKLADCANDEGENVYPSVGRIERETRLGASTVRRTLAAFEQAGLLEVVAEAHGNKWSRSTTIRRFNLARLHDLSAVDVRGQLRPSTHLLREVKAHVPAGATVVVVPNAYGREAVAVEPAGKDREIDVWVIVARGPSDKSDYDPPLPQREGRRKFTPPTAGGDPSHSGSPPLPQREPTPPTAGANPSIEPSLNHHTHTARVRADETRGEGEGEDPLGWLLGGKADHVVEKLIRPLSRLPMRAAHFPSPKLTLAAIRDRFVEDADAVLAAAAAELTGSRTIFPSEAIIKTAVEKARATHNRPITITPASPQWQAWLAHWRASGQPRQASIAETRGEWFVDRAWPPGAEPRRDVA